MKKWVVLFAAAVIIVLGIGIYLIQKDNANPHTREEAIRQAQEYQPEGECTLLPVTAIHEATGSEYTFPNGCLAPGWKPKQ